MIVNTPPAFKLLQQGKTLSLYAIERDFSAQDLSKLAHEYGVSFCDVEVITRETQIAGLDLLGDSPELPYVVVNHV